MVYSAVRTEDIFSPDTLAVFGALSGAIASGKLSDDQRASMISTCVDAVFQLSGTDQEEMEKYIGKNGNALAVFLRDYGSLLTEEQKNICGGTITRYDHSGYAIKDILRYFPSGHEVVNKGIVRMLEIGRTYLQLPDRTVNKEGDLLSHKLLLRLTQDFSRSSLSEEQQRLLKKQVVALEVAVDDIIHDRMMERGRNMSSRFSSAIASLREKTTPEFTDKPLDIVA